MKTLAEQAQNKPNEVTIEESGRRSRRRAKTNQKGSKLDVDIKEQLENYKNITEFITVDTDFKQLFLDNFKLESEQAPGICLSGLHTCGNLAPSCLTIYNKNKAISALCNVGCCYHLMTEQFSRFTYVGLRDKEGRKSSVKNLRDAYAEIEDKNNPGFPLSKYLTTRQVQLGRNPRMLACQSIQRVIHRKEHPHNHLFFRSLLDILIQDKRKEYYDVIEVGKVKPSNTFVEYVRKCVKNNKYLNFDDVTDDELNELAEKYSTQKYYSDLFYLIRLSLAQVIETSILLDRLLYLKEMDEEHNRCGDDRKSFLVRLFDPVVSPRCYGIVAIK